MSHPERIVEQQELRPERELLTSDGEYRWFVYGAKDLGMPLVCLEDCRTGIVVSTPIANPNIRVAAHKAWAGARQSRAAGTPWEIRHEMGMKGVDPDVKLEEMFKGYGHASVGDMARIQVEFARTPMHAPLAFFNLGSVNSGQEKSTRYQQKFGKGFIHEIRHYLPDHIPPQEIENLEIRYQRLGELSLELFEGCKETLAREFQEFYNPEQGQLGSLNSRVLDCARYFLLLGQQTGFAFETSARDWSRIIADLKASPVGIYGCLASQVERLLVPTKEEEEYLGYKAEAPGLIRHTEADCTTNRNLAALKKYIVEYSDLFDPVRRTVGGVYKSQAVEIIPGKYTEGDKLAAQYILSAWPGIDRRKLLDWIHCRPEQVKQQISQIIFDGHSNYKELPGLARTTGMTLVFETFLGEARDFNRHRAQGRFVDLPLVHGLPIDSRTAWQIYSRGFGLPLYLTETQLGQGMQEKFIRGMEAYYHELGEFIKQVLERYGESIDYSFIINLLPLAHRVDLWMHGDPKQALYFTHQRSRPGGHINYRMLAYEANQLIADSDPYLSGMRLEKRPDPASRQEFFDRG